MGAARERAWAWRGVDGTVQLVAGLAAAATVGTATSMLPLGPLAWIALLTAAGLVGGSFGRWAVQGEAAGRVISRAVVAGAGLAVLLAGCMLPPLLFLSLQPPRGIGELATGGPWVSLAGMIVGAPVGAAIALFYAPLLIVAARARQNPSHAAGEHVARFGAGWLLAVAALQAWFVSGVNHDEPKNVGQAVVWVFAWAAPLLSAVGFFAASLHKRAARRRFVEDVRAGKIAGYRVEPLAQIHSTKELMPVEHDERACEEVLVRVADEREADYRTLATHDESEPLALVSRR